MTDPFARLKTLTSADFAAHLHTDFMVPFSDADPWTLTLSEVSELGQDRIAAGPDGQPVKAFSLIFSHPVQERYLTQGTFVLQHEQLGELALFLVPLGPADGVMRYQALFT